jgi:hypothetical protein
VLGRDTKGAVVKEMFKAQGEHLELGKHRCIRAMVNWLSLKKSIINTIVFLPASKSLGMKHKALTHTDMCKSPEKI